MLVKGVMYELVESAVVSVAVVGASWLGMVQSHDFLG